MHMLIQKYWFFVAKIPNAKPECKTHDISDQNGENLYMSSFLHRSKTFPFGTAHTYIAHIRHSLPGIVPYKELKPRILRFPNETKK